MDTITREELKDLADSRHTRCVSLYRTLHRRYPHTQQNQAKLREALDQAQAQMVEEGWDVGQIQQILRPAEKLLANADFWESSDARGLAVFLTNDADGNVEIKTYRLPYIVAESVDVGDRFHLTPLVPLVDASMGFDLLALGQNSVRLYSCNHMNAKPVELPQGVPQSFQQFTAGTDVGKPTQIRASVATGAGGNQTSIVHGQTSSKDEHKARVHEFVSQVGSQLSHWLEGRNVPLVLAAVDSFHPIFRKSCSYTGLVPDGVHGSPDELSENELHEQATQRVRHDRQQHMSDFNGRYASRMAHGHVTSELALIPSAASAGRVESLVIADGLRVWGQVDQHQPRAVVHQTKSCGDRDLLDVAVAETLAHGGDVHAVDCQSMPDGSTATALLRW